MASPGSISGVPDTQLGLSNEEIQLLRRHQINASNAAGSTSSRAASRASSQGLLLLDGSSLAALTRHFDQLMLQISERLNYLIQQSDTATQQQYDRAGNAIEMADAEIARLNDILTQIDELEDDLDRLKHIREIVAGYRQRVENMERQVDRSGAGRESHGHSHRHRHGESSGSSRRHRR